MFTLGSIICNDLTLLSLYLYNKVFSPKEILLDTNTLY